MSRVLQPIAFLVALLLTIPRGWAAGPPAPPPAWQLALQTGRVIDAATLVAEQAAGLPDDQARLSSYDLLIEICTTFYVAECIRKHLPAYMELARKLDSKVHQQIALFAYLLERFVSGDRTEVDRYRHFSPEAAPFISSFATSVLSLSADIHHSYGEFQETADDAARLLAHALTEKAQPYYAARDLVRLLQVLNANLDTITALRVDEIASQFINANLRAGSAEHALYLYELTNTYAHMGFDPRYLQLLQDARRAISKIQLEPWRHDVFKASLTTREASLRAVASDREGALAVLREHPVAAHREEIIKQGKFVNFVTMAYAMVEMFVEGVTGGTIDQRWAPAFEQPLTFQPQGALIGVEEKSFRAFARALLSAKTDQQAARRHLYEAARYRLSIFETRFAESDEGLPLPHFVDRILFGILAMKPPETRAEQDLLLQAAEYMNRNPQYALADTLARLSAAPDEDTRQLVHASMRISDDRAEWIRSRLRELVTWKPDPSGKDKAADDRRYPVLREMEEFLELQIDIRQSLKMRKVAAAKGRLVSLEELQSALADDEAFVTHILSFEGLVKLCVTKTDMWQARQAFDQAVILQDIKLVQSDLADVRPISARGDARHPVESSRRLYELLLGGLEPCLQGGKHLIITMPAEATGIPAAALLTGMPKQVDDGYELKSAPWLIRQHPVSQAVSARSFIASRMLSRRQSGDLPFIGVGNPKLQEASASLPSAHVAALRSAARRGGALRQLTELPETADELRSIASQFSSGTKLLLGAEATKFGVLAEQLDRYQVIQFATHGLVNGELAELNQAALVLTPGDRDPSDDGLLTASEIASLKLRARLAVLSACNTAAFDPRAFGSQLQGLTTAFAISGVPTSLASLWPVESTTAQNLMSNLHKQMHSSSHPAAAVAFQRAILQVIDKAPIPELTHPRFWSPFIMLGDGGVAFDQIKAGDVPLASRVDLSTPGGEILGGIRAGADVITSEIGPEYDGRHAAVIQRRSADGALKWRIEDKVVGAGPLTRIGEDLGMLGYVSKPGGGMSPVLKAVSLDGRELWQREIDPTVNAGWGGAAPWTADKSVGAIVPFPRETGSEISATLLIFDQDGQVASRLSLPLPPASGVGGYRGTLAVNGDNALMLLSRPRQITSRQRNGALSLRRNCWDGGSTVVYLVDLKTVSIVRRNAISNVTLDHVSPRGDGFLVGGTRPLDCDLGDRGFVGRMGSDLQLAELWTDDGAFKSRVTGIMETHEGWKAIGTVERTLGVKPIVIGPPKVDFSMADLRELTSSRYTAAEVFVLDADVGGRVTRRASSTGMRLSVMGVTEGQAPWMAYGSASFFPWSGWVH